MFVHLAQVIFAAIRTVSRSVLNILLYSLLSRVFNKWFGFSTLISFVCSAYCLSKLMGYFKRFWLTARLKKKQSDEKIVLNELSWTSSRPNNEDDKFEIDWKYLLDDDTKNFFPSIVDIPFNNSWLFFVTLILTDYQINHFNYNYLTSLIRTIVFFVVLICGSAVRYQTLFERDKTKFLNLMSKQPDEFERYIIYSTNNCIPIASFCLQITNTTENAIFMVQLYQLNSKFEDYFHDIANYACQNLIERVKVYGNRNKTSVYLIWSFPTCKRNWIYAIKMNKLFLINTYKDFSFMPLVNSYVEQYQYEYEYEYEDLLSEPIDDTKKSQ